MILGRTNKTRIMKRLLPFALLLILASCEIYIIEDPNAWDERDLFIGSYDVEEYSQTTDRTYTYNIHIIKSCCRANEVKITNFYGTDLTVYGFVDDNRITIPLQQTDGYEIEGTGKMINGRLQDYVLCQGYLTLIQYSLILLIWKAGHINKGLVR
jgi:hypothetical protein